MSLAEKLLIVAQNEPKVFEAGKTSAIQGISPAVIDTSVFQEELQTIANNTLRVFEAGRQSANMLKATASGAVIRVDDVNPVGHKLGVTVKSKNLLNLSNRTVRDFGNVVTTPTTQRAFEENGLYKNMSYNNYSVYYHNYDCEVIDNNSFNVICNSTVSMEAASAYGMAINFIVKPQNVYSVSANYDATKGKIKGICFYDKDGMYISHWTSVVNVVAPDNAYWMIVVFGCLVNGEYVSFNNIQVEVSETATEYTPYITDFSEVEVSRYGKNLLPYPYTNLSAGTTTINGITCTTSEDGSILINGTATANVTKYLYQDLTGKPDWVKEGTVIMISKNADKETEQSKVYFIANYYDANGSMRQGIVASNGSADTGTITSGWVGVGFYIHIPQGNSIDNLTLKPMIELGSTATEYEPYKEPQTATATADGTVEGLTSISPSMTILTDAEVVTIDLEYYKGL